MGNQLRDKNDIKIFILYLLCHVSYPLDFVSINDIVVQDGFVGYFDFVECFAELLETGNIMEIPADGDREELYMITDKGRIVARELRGAVTPGILDDSLAKALTYLDFKKRGIVAMCDIEDASMGRFYLTCSLKEKDEIIFKQTIMVDSFERAKLLERNFYDRPDAVYRGVHALLAGKVSYLFD